MRKLVWGIGLTIAGFAAGMAFIAACGQSSEGSGPALGPTPAAAQQSCAVYETALFSRADDAPYGTPSALPAGWIPFAVSTANNVFAFRCAQ